MIDAHDYVNPSFNYLPRFRQTRPQLLDRRRVLSKSVRRVRRCPAAYQSHWRDAGLSGCAFVLGWMAAEGRGSSAEARVHAGLWSAVGLATAPRLVMFAKTIFIASGSPRSCR